MHDNGIEKGKEEDEWKGWNLHDDDRTCRRTWYDLREGKGGGGTRIAIMSFPKLRRQQQKENSHP